MWMLGESILGYGTIFRDIPQLYLEECQNWRRKDDLAFKAFIWTLSAGSWISSPGTGFLWGLQHVALGMCVPHNGCQHKGPWSWLQEVCTSLHCSGGLYGDTAPFPENTAAPVQALLCACWSCADSSSGVRVVVAHLDISIPHSSCKPRKHWGTEKQTQSS